MAKRMIDKCWNGEVVVRVYWDYEWTEFQVTLESCGKKIPSATYHTNDREDAIQTSLSMMMNEYNRIKLERKLAVGSVVVTDFSLL